MGGKWPANRSTPPDPRETHSTAVCGRGFRQAPRDRPRALHPIAAQRRLVPPGSVVIASNGVLYRWRRCYIGYVEIVRVHASLSSRISGLVRNRASFREADEATAGTGSHSHREPSSWRLTNLGDCRYPPSSVSDCDRLRDIVGQFSSSSMRCRMRHGRRPR